ncbi:dethiobiotin synthase [Sphingorhabdus sp. Alg239-R122]|uniref:dethiobiotin synthase n=1 Tax=Sphingorhabdus sp. Alg239-R122 TaxID=2305989 RepID=UPI0013DC6596|nr:dethiobiotin synthase [Sphingorhabdus sp. Alg239-R122]
MTDRMIVTGTDTDIGKTVFAAALLSALDRGTGKAAYWKPVQAGTEPETDSMVVRRLSGVQDSAILPEAYVLKTPASPHHAANIEGMEINAEALSLPQHDGPLVVEGAGGALVPLSDNLLYTDMFAYWDIPAIIVARTALGTINHSLLTIDALNARNVPILGIAFVGEHAGESERVICAMGGVRHLGRLPMLDTLDKAALDIAFDTHFDVQDFTA